MSVPCSFRGDSGVTYRVRQRVSDKPNFYGFSSERDPVFIKFFQGNALRFFEREVFAYQQFAKGKAPSSIVGMTDTVVEEDFSALVLPRIQGYHLGLEAGKVNLEETIEFLQRIVEAQNYAHSFGIYDRDIKPSNCIYRKMNLESPIARVDWGIVCHSSLPTLDSKDGYFNGSIAFTPNEVMTQKQRNCDERVEVFALSTSTIELLAGSVYNDELKTAFERIILGKPPPEINNMKVSSRVKNVILKGISKDPDNRFQTLDEYLGALKDEVKTQDRPTTSFLRRMLGRA